MAKVSSRHPQRDKTFSFNSFDYGLDKESSPVNLPITALTKAKNVKYKLTKDANGQSIVIIQKRQGTQVISASAISAPIVACTYYYAQAQYIIASATTLYYLDASYAPQTIGTISGTPTFTEFHGKLIIHDGGVTKAWNGTTFETLNCLYDDVAIETGNNSDTVFTGTLNAPVAASTITITYTDSTSKTITDDGAGAFTGDCTTGTIDYTTGAYSFTCTGAPDNSTSVYATYEKSGGAPKSKAGFVRASRLYLWGDSDNVSRLWYSGANDEDAWDSTSSGGYLDVDPQDGTSLTGCLNFFDSIVCVKDNSLHRIDNFPGDTTFRVVPLMRNSGSLAYRTILSAGDIHVYLSKEGYNVISATDKYGDVQRGPDVSARFREDAVNYGNQYCYAAYNQQDKQIWLTLYYNASLNVPEIYVINLASGGQLSLYEFKFKHSSYSYVNNEMLIGGSDGKLYRLLQDYDNYTDNGTSYTTDTYIRGVMTDFGATFARVHNKWIYPHLYGKGNATATLNIYTDQDYSTVVKTESLSTTGGDTLINSDQTTKIYDDTAKIGAEYVSTSTKPLHRKFDFKEVCFELTSMAGDLGCEWWGMDFSGAVIGYYQEV